jgi:hypothetical protein
LVNSRIVYIKSNFYRKNSFNIVLEINMTEKEKLLRYGIKMNWRICKVVESNYIKKCYNCSGFGHYSSQCRNEAACNNCAGSHLSRECREKDVYCINCIKVNAKFEMKHDTKHTARDQQCPCYIRAKQIQQYQSEMGFDRKTKP